MSWSIRDQAGDFTEMHHWGRCGKRVGLSRAPALPPGEVHELWPQQVRRSGFPLPRRLQRPRERESDMGESGCTCGGRGDDLSPGTGSESREVDNKVIIRG